MIVLHTAAFRGKADATTIDRWHREKGWDMNGYHKVVTGSFFDDYPEVQEGRPLGYQGAHAYGGSRHSIGICVTGHGDHLEWTEEQMKLLCPLVCDLMAEYDIPLKKVIGHRDTKFEKMTRRKTCPGKLIDMEEVRKTIFGKELKPLSQKMNISHDKFWYKEKIHW